LTAAKGSVLTLIGAISGKSLSFLLRFLVIRLLGATWFGYYAIAMAMIELVRTFASIGLPKGGMRLLAMALASGDKEQLPRIINTAVVIPVLLSIIGCLLLFGAADLVANLWFGDAELAIIFKLFSVTIPFATLLKVGCELSRGFLTTRYAVLVENFLVPVAQMALFLLFYFLRHDFSALIFASILAYALGGCSMLFFLFRQLRRVFGPDMPFRLPWRQRFLDRAGGVELVRYSFPLFLTGITGIMLNSIDIFLLGRFLAAEDVGVYVAGSMVATFISTSLVIPVNSIFVPMVAARYGCNDLAAIKHLYVATTRWLFIFALPLITCMILARNYIMAIFGESFVAEGAVVLLILAIGHLVNCLTGGVGQILSMTGHPPKELAINLLAVVINIVLNLMLIPRYGIVGAALATSAAMVLVNVLRIVVVYKLFNMQPFTARLVGIFAVGFFLVSAQLLFLESAGWVFDLLSTVVTCAALTALIWLKGLNAEDRELLWEVRVRFSRFTR